MGLAAATLDAFLATCFTWAVTAAGAALVFVLPPDEATQRQLLKPMLGFAGGVMTSASFFSLLAPALELAEDQLGRRWSFVPLRLVSSWAARSSIYVMSTWKRNRSTTRSRSCRTPY